MFNIFQKIKNNINIEPIWFTLKIKFFFHLMKKTNNVIVIVTNFTKSYTFNNNNNKIYTNVKHQCKLNYLIF